MAPTIPELTPTVATDVLLLLQVPPLTESERTVVVLVQSANAPGTTVLNICDGLAFTVIVLLELHNPIV